MTTYGNTQTSRTDRGTFAVEVLFFVLGYAGSITMLTYAMTGFEDLAAVHDVRSGTPGADVLWNLTCIATMTGLAGGALCATSDILGGTTRSLSLPLFCALTMLAATGATLALFLTGSVGEFPILLWLQPVGVYVVGMVVGNVFMHAGQV